LILKITIADSNQIFREGLKNVLSQHDDFELTALASNNEELLEIIEHNQPNLVIIDYDAKGFTKDIVSDIQLSHPEIKFIGITNYFSGQAIINAWRNGVLSHLQKKCSIRELEEAIYATAQSEQFFCDQLVENLQHEKIDVNQFEKHAEEFEQVNLSDRELEIIKHIAEGYTNAQIAVVLYISNHTVNTHRKNIMKKIGVNNTAGIVMYAVKMKLVHPEKFSFAPADDE